MKPTPAVLLRFHSAPSSCHLKQPEQFVCPLESSCGETVSGTTLLRMSFSVAMMCFTNRFAASSMLRLSWRGEAHRSGRNCAAECVSCIHPFHFLLHRIIFLSKPGSCVCLLLFETTSCKSLKHLSIYSKADVQICSYNHTLKSLSKPAPCDL